MTLQFVLDADLATEFGGSTRDVLTVGDMMFMEEVEQYANHDCHLSEDDGCQPCEDMAKLEMERKIEHEAWKDNL
jgi:hypothetical protein